MKAWRSEAVLASLATLVASRSMLQLILLLCCSALTTPVLADVRGVASVIDGDTLEIHGAKIRLHGVDAPESAQLCQREARQPYRCGQQAALALSDKIGRQVVRCVEKDTDRYGRIVAVCYLGSEDLNRWLVATGNALAYTQFSRDYAPAEADAKKARIGMWAGTFQSPWDYRADRRADVSAPRASTIDPPQIAPEMAAAGDATPCCRACKKGQPCGASCISWDKTCHKPCRQC